VQLIIKTLQNKVLWNNIILYWMFILKYIYHNSNQFLPLSIIRLERININQIKQIIHQKGKNQKMHWNFANAATKLKMNLESNWDWETCPWYQLFKREGRPTQQNKDNLRKSKGSYRISIEGKVKQWMLRSLYYPMFIEPVHILRKLYRDCKTQEFIV
jgi:hypothetical protein